MQLCLEHLTEHNLRNVHRVDELSNQLNLLSDSVSGLSTQSTLEKARSGVEEWKRLVIQAVEKVCENKHHQIDRLENELNTRLEIYREEIQAKLSAIQMRLNSLQKYGEVSEKVISILSIHDCRTEEFLCLTLAIVTDRGALARTRATRPFVEL